MQTQLFKLGLILFLLGLLWSHVDLPHAWGVTAVVLIVYAAYANWLASLLAAFWGAGRKLAPIAAGDHEGTTARESVASCWCHCRWRSSLASSSSSSGSEDEHRCERRRIA